MKKPFYMCTEAHVRQQVQALSAAQQAMVLSGDLVIINTGPLLVLDVHWVTALPRSVPYFQRMVSMMLKVWGSHDVSS